MSDWTAVDDRVLGVKAGLDLEMPGPSPYNDAAIVEAVKSGALDVKQLDWCLENILNVFLKTEANKKKIETDFEKNHEIARNVAEESIVLLKNEGNILPLKPGQKIAFIGEYATNPRHQGSGSSRVNCAKLTNAFDAAQKVADVKYARGFDGDNAGSPLIAEAVALAKSCEAAVIFVGLPDSYESEGYDRSHMGIPPSHVELIKEVAKVQKKVIVVLHNGAPVEMPWASDASAILETYLCGQAVGDATVNILFGKVNPSGRLAETFPIRCQDNPAYLSFAPREEIVRYGEDVFVGYRYYDKKEIDVLFPFGYGLSYTTFDFSNLQCPKEIKDTDTVTVKVDVKNSGKVAGKEVIQLYVSDKTEYANRPPKELKAFAKVDLAPGEVKTVTLTLNKRSFAFWNVKTQDWYCHSGEYEILIGKSAQEIVLRHSLKLTSTGKSGRVFDLSSSYTTLALYPETRGLAEKLLDKIPKARETLASEDPTLGFMKTLVWGSPLRALAVMYGWSPAETKAIVDEANKLIGAK
jgi:beta-glucosidase